MLCLAHPSYLQERDLKLLRETLTGDEVAAALASRANMVIRKRGIGLEELDYRSVRTCAELHGSRLVRKYPIAGAAGAGAAGLRSGLPQDGGMTAICRLFWCHSVSAAPGRCQAGQLGSWRHG
jgi:hypothetical protein